MESNGLNSIFIKKCKIPVQLVRHTAPQLPLSSYTVIPTLLQSHTLLASCLFHLLFTQECILGCCLVEQAFPFDHTLEDLV